MDDKNKVRRKATSCGGLPWRFRDNKLQVLLVKQFIHSDNWGVPKGHIKEGESLEDCALREIREETGVEVFLTSRLPDITSVHRDEEKTVVLWLAQPIGDDDPCHDNPDSEVADARWFNVGELPPIHNYQRYIIGHAIELIERDLRGDDAP